MQDLMAALPQFDFVFASTPEDGGVWIRGPPGGKGEDDEDDEDYGGKEDGDYGDKEDGDWWNWDDKEKNKGRKKSKKKGKQAKNKGVTTDEDWADLSISYLDQMVQSQEYEFYRLHKIENVTYRTCNMWHNAPIPKVVDTEFSMCRERRNFCVSTLFGVWPVPYGSYNIF